MDSTADQEPSSGVPLRAVCPICGYAMIANPRTDYETLYDENYYSGKGADRCIDYMAELEHPGTTLRKFEWKGILGAVEHLVGDLSN
jgi:hypothetical protein